MDFRFFKLFLLHLVCTFGKRKKIIPLGAMKLIKTSHHKKRLLRIPPQTHFLFDFTIERNPSVRIGHTQQ